MARRVRHIAGLGAFLRLRATGDIVIALLTLKAHGRGAPTREHETQIRAALQLLDRLSAPA
jgi:hypothetical protein